MPRLLVHVEDQTEENKTPGAVFSADRTYRFLLTREVGGGEGAVNFVLLNPSTADEERDDPTIRRCVGFARSWGFGLLLVTNVSPLRATDSRVLRRRGPEPEAVARRNLEQVVDAAARSRMVVLAYGNNGEWEDRGREDAWPSWRRRASRSTPWDSPSAGIRVMSSISGETPSRPLSTRGLGRRVEAPCADVYSLIADLEELASRFEFDGGRLSFKSAYNVAPTQEVLTVVGGETTRRAGFMRWGLIPPWAESASVGSGMINARAETVAEKPAFRDALRRRRCLVLADGFYEWQRRGGARRPMRILMRSGEPFAFAGLWSVWTDPDGNRVASCAIVTTAANDLLRPIHDRMPVILPREPENLWLAPGVQDPAVLADVLRPHPSEAMEAYEVSGLVNSFANDGPEVIEPAGQIQLPLVGERLPQYLQTRASGPLESTAFVI